MLDSTALFQILLTIHLIGLALGLGGATVTDFSFVRTLRMGDRITPETVTWMRSFSSLIWVGLGMLALSGIGLFLLHPSEYLQSPGFQAKMIFVVILTINGLFLNYYATARLTTFNFSQQYQRHDAAWKARKFSFMFGAISTTSWYAVLIVAMFKGLTGLSLAELLAIYIFVLVGAITGALLLEKYIIKLTSAKIARPSVPTIDVLATQGQTITAPAPTPPVQLATPLAVPQIPPAFQPQNPMVAAQPIVDEQPQAPRQEAKQ